VKYVEVRGARVSAIGLGTWQFGSREWGYGKEFADTEAIAITRRALDLGINLVDTAEIYAFGASERTVGRAIEGRRDEAFLATKVFPVVPVAPIVEQRGRASAARLGVDTIDLYQVHWPNPVVPLGTTMQGMAKLRDEGVVRHIGVSNFSLDKWREAERHLGQPVLSNQVEFSLAVRRPERELLPFAEDEGRLIIAYSPLAQGLLSGRYDGTNTPAGIRAAKPLFLPENIAKAQPLLDALREIASAHGATPSQVALAWVIRRPNVVAIPGASSVAQLESNAAAADLELSDDDDARLTEASDRFRPVGGLAAVPRLLKARLGL
jgi:aryl-alcohol dehydrogenase-like predicted oxidoreductase